MFSKYVLFKKGHLNKRAGVWAPWTPPLDPLLVPGTTVTHRTTAEPSENCEMLFGEQICMSASNRVFIWG